MKTKMGNIAIAFAIAVLLEGLLVIGFHSSEEGTALQREMIRFGGDLPNGLIQFVTYFLFFFGMLEIKTLASRVKYEEQAYNFRILPEKENYVLSPADIMELKNYVIKKYHVQKFLLTDLIKKACIKYRSNSSVSEVINVVNQQVRINLSISESEQSLIRYISWAVPSVGFIGTIIGIANSLGFANVMGQAGISKVTNALNVAFDTTLVALLLSLILMLFLHIVQEKTDKLHANMEEYILDNLVNKISNK